MVISDEEYTRRLATIVEEAPSNCIGTALYLTGKIPEDLERWPSEFSFFNLCKNFDLERIAEPEKLSLACWTRKEGDDFYVMHMGVVTGLDPLVITSRHGYQGHFVIDEPFVSVDRRYCFLWMGKSLREKAKFSVKYLK